MELVVSLYPYDRWPSVNDMVDAARLADRLGIHGMSFADHIVAPVAEDLPPIGEQWYDNITFAAHLAAVTERLRFYFYTLVLPYRNPVVVAKQISTLDTLSHGRVTLSVAAGWFRQEFDAVGASFEDRGARLDEYLAAMKALWTEDRPEYHGKYVSFDHLVFRPRCAQQPHVPVWIGGSGPRPLQRVAAAGDGWAPMLGTPEEIAESRQWLTGQRDWPGGVVPIMFSLQVGEGDDAVKGAFRHAGGEEQPTSADLPDRTEAAVAALEEYAEAGVTHMLVVFGGEDAAQNAAQLEWIARDVAPRVAAR